MSPDDASSSGTDADTAGVAGLMPPRQPVKAGRGRLRGVATFVAFLVGCALAGAGVGYLASRLDFGPIIPQGQEWILLGAFLLSLWPNIVIHEAGHALAGLSRGMRAIAFGVGPLRWERGSDRWRMRHGGGVRGISGFAALVPEGDRGLGRSDQMLFLIGGPLANLLTAALGLAMLPLLQGAQWLAATVLGIAVSALLIGLVNLTPFHSDGWSSDGRGLLGLLRNDPQAGLQRQVNQLMALTFAGVRPRDWPPALLPAQGNAHDMPMLALAADTLRLSHATDRRDLPAATAAARRLVARFWEAPEAIRPALAVGMGSYAALLARDADMLAAWRPLCEGGLTDLAPFRHWLDAELAMLRGDASRAHEQIQSLRETLPRAPDPVSLALLGEYLAELERALARSADRTPGPAPSTVKDA